MKSNRNVLEVLFWFDIFDWPLGAFEIQKYTGIKNFNAILKGVTGTIENLNGFYFLKGRKEITKRRILRQKIAIKKIKIAKRASKILSFIPFVKMIAVCNDLSYFNAPEESDIDFFIIIKSGRIWIARFFSTAVLFLFRLWRHEKKIKDRICLSFFICDDALSFKKIAYKNDIYLKYWILQIFPLFNKNQVYQKFLNENSWVTNNYPGFFQNIPSLKIWVSQKSLQLIFEKILNGWLGNILEKTVRRIQIKFMKKTIPFQREKDVIISDRMLKFHENDRRKYFRDIFQKKLIEIYRNS